MKVDRVGESLDKLRSLAAHCVELRRFACYDLVAGRIRRLDQSAAFVDMHAVDVVAVVISAPIRLAPGWGVVRRPLDVRPSDPPPRRRRGLGCGDVELCPRTRSRIAQGPIGGLDIGAGSAGSN